MMGYHKRAENGLVRPISKKDLFDTFNSYRMMLGEDEDKVKTMNRLYGGKRKSNQSGF